MKTIPLSKVTSAEEARDIAIDWQNWASEQTLSYGELADWQAYFEALADKFPEIRDELQENGII